MKLRLLCLAPAALVLTAAAHADATFDRTVSVGSSADLYVISGSGNVRVHPGNSSTVHIVGHVHGSMSFFSNRSDLDGRIRQVAEHPPIQQTGNETHVGADHDPSLFNNISIDYEITAPENIALDLQTGSGDIEVDNLGRYLKAQSGSGSVRAHGVRGEASLQTGSGDIELEQLAPGGNVSARSGSGSVRVHGFHGALALRTGSGDIEAEGELTGAAALRSGSGSVRLYIQRDAHFNLQAESGSGTIRVNFPNAPHQDEGHEHHLSGPVNGGGSPIEAQTGSGDIEIDPR